jgi:hypothetical protein
MGAIFVLVVLFLPKGLAGLVDMLAGIVGRRRRGLGEIAATRYKPGFAAARTRRIGGAS